MKIRLSPDRRKVVGVELTEGARLHTGFLVMVGLSCVIAAFGLLANSAAVIIGAMLVAPLMSPIFALALSLVNGDRRLFNSALVSEALGVLLAVGVAILIGLIVPEMDPGSEILSRTKPTLFDLAVAVAAGLAGAYAMTRENVSPILPGVAIATALMPPLAVVGLGLAFRDWAVAGGAFVLFAANFVAIFLASALVFILAGFAPYEDWRSPKIILHRFGLSLFLLLAVALFMGHTLHVIVSANRRQKEVQALLSQQIHMIPGTSLNRLTVKEEKGKLTISASVFTPSGFEPVMVGAIQNVLQDRLRHPVDLSIRSVLVKEADSRGYHFIEEEKPVKPVPEPPPPKALDAQVREILESQALMVPGASLKDFSLTFAQDGTVAVRATYRSPVSFDSSLVAGIGNLLRSKLGRNLRVEVTADTLTSGGPATTAKGLK